MNANDARYSVDEIARAWVVKMRGVSSDALRAEFKEWLASAPEHRAAYDRVERQLDRAAILKISSRFGEDRAGRRSQLLAGRWLSWGAFATIAGLLLIGYGAFGATLPGPFSAGSAKAVAAETFTTDRGEIRRFQLADGAAPRDRRISSTSSRFNSATRGDGGSRRNKGPRIHPSAPRSRRGALLHRDTDSELRMCLPDVGWTGSMPGTGISRPKESLIERSSTGDSLGCDLTDR